MSFPSLLGLAVANLALGLFNLAPIYPLDGGQITRGLLKLVFGEKHADTIMLVFSLPLAVALTFLGLYMRDIIVILTGLLLILAVSSLNPRMYNQLTIAVLYFIDRASFYLKRGDFDKALEVINRSIKQYPNRAGLFITRSIIYLNSAEFELAKADNERALALDANNPISWTLRGEFLSLANQHQAAMEAFNRAIQIRPSFGLAYLDRGSLFQQQGSLAQALEDMNRAADLSQGSVIVYILRSILRYQMGDINGAREDGDKAMRYAPHWMLSFSEIFLVNLEGHLNWALDYYWRAIQRMPTAYQAYQGRADACRVNGRLDWAIADYNRAIQLAPQQAELYLSRGRCYQQLGYPVYAEADFQRTLATLQNNRTCAARPARFYKQSDRWIGCPCFNCTRTSRIRGAISGIRTSSATA
jgi:tetratricopeptide (TPR) repeat protein